MGLDDLLHDGQSGACAWVLLARMQALENFKDPPKMLGRNANAVIAHRKAIVPCLLCPPNGDLRCPPIRSKFQGITQQVAKNLGQAHFWIDYRGQRRRHMDMRLAIEDFELQVVQYAVEDLTDIHGYRLGMQASDARVFQQAVQELFHV